jgi:hypothetical protein
MLILIVPVDKGSIAVPGSETVPKRCSDVGKQREMLEESPYMHLNAWRMRTLQRANKRIANGKFVS